MRLAGIQACETLSNSICRYCRAENAAAALCRPPLCHAAIHSPQLRLALSFAFHVAVILLQRSDSIFFFLCILTLLHFPVSPRFSSLLEYRMPTVTDSRAFSCHILAATCAASPNSRRSVRCLVAQSLIFVPDRCRTSHVYGSRDIDGRHGSSLIQTRAASGREHKPSASCPRLLGGL